MEANQINSVMTDTQVQVREEWSKWECPVCGDVCYDPESIVSTTCHSGHIVLLSGIDKNGNRTAFLEESLNDNKNKSK